MKEWRNKQTIKTINNVLKQIKRNNTIADVSWLPSLACDLPQAILNFYITAYLDLRPHFKRKLNNWNAISNKCISNC